MAKEIERKFLVVNDSYKELCNTVLNISQGYITTDKKAVVRVRTCNEKGFLTIKGENSGAVRDEWEYPIPVDDAKEMIRKLAGNTVIAKTRYLIDFKGFRWEVDEFHSPAAGLVVAEIELHDESTEFPLPPFIGEEVTGNPAYYNSSIAAAGKLNS